VLAASHSIVLVVVNIFEKSLGIHKSLPIQLPFLLEQRAASRGDLLPHTKAATLDLRGGGQATQQRSARVFTARGPWQSQHAREE